MIRRLRMLVLVAAVLAAWFLLGRPGLLRSESGVRGPEAGGGESADAVSGEPEGTAPSPAERALADRVGGGLFRLRTALAEGRLGAACSERDALAHLELSAALAARRAAGARELDAALVAAPGAWRELVRAGRVLEARARLVAARAPEHALVAPLLDDLAAEFGLRSLPFESAAAGADDGAPLAENRLVRVAFREGWHTARLVGAGGGGYTVKVETADGVYFPRKARLDLEPVEPTVAEASAQAELALASGDRLGAALWVGHLHLRGAVDLARWRSRLQN
jgi:hypothetical protein